MTKTIDLANIDTPHEGGITPDLTLTGSLLVEQFNMMVETAIDLGLTAFKPVNRFATNTKGVERTEVLHKAILKRAQDLRDAEQEAAEREMASMKRTEGRGDETSKEELELEDEGEATKRAQELNAHYGNPDNFTNTEGNPAPGTEETLERLPNESEEEHMARKAAAKKARKTRTKATDKPKASGAGRKVKSTNGTTIREMTEEYNRLVPAARKAGVEWAKHHTSNFESKEKAEKATAKLKDAMKKASK
jgi:hypothetical protein